MIKQSAELIFVPAPGMGHLMSAVEVAKLLVSRDPRLYISVLIIKFPFDSQITSFSESFISSSVADSTSQRINFIDLPTIQIDRANFGFINFLSSFFDDHKPLVRDAVNKLIESGSGPRLAGFVVDPFCSAMIDVADEFGVPSYVFFTSGAGCLSVMSHFQALNDDHTIDFTELNDKPDLELLVPGFLNPVPAKVLPGFLTDKAAVSLFFNNARRTRKTEGILVNTFTELESNVIQSLSNKDSFPPVYPVGPVLNLNLGGADNKKTEVVAWLDNQPPSSVVFLCFGSMGSFREHQVKEIASALEKSGVRFLWSLRQPPQKGNLVPADYADPNEVLPEGFLNRTAEIGKVIGWAPQVTILAHPAVGGFVSHCGWNSTLESLWFGVPIATWPLFAEQQLNAFQMVRELGLAVEIKVDYRTEHNKATGDDPDALILKAEEIERGIRSVMVQDSDTRKKVKEMSEKSRKGLLDGGASYSSLGRFIGDVMENMPLKSSLIQTNPIIS